jgi:hypothetical protein
MLLKLEKGHQHMCLRKKERSMKNQNSINHCNNRLKILNQKILGISKQDTNLKVIIRILSRMLYGKQKKKIRVKVETILAAKPKQPRPRVLPSNKLSQLLILIKQKK